MSHSKTSQILFFLLIIFSFCSSSIAQEVEIQASGQIKNVKDPIDPQDAVTKSYVDAILLNFGISLGSSGIQGLLDAGYWPLELISVGAEKDSLYGKTYQGGLIFYLDDLDSIPGIKGLVAAPSDQSAGSEWGCNGIDLQIPNVGFPPSGPGAEIGDGATNTVGIDTAMCSMSGDAAVICTNLDLSSFDDWFLPSIDELNEIYLKNWSGSQWSKSKILADLRMSCIGVLLSSMVTMPGFSNSPMAFLT